MTGTGRIASVGAGLVVLLLHGIACGGLIAYYPLNGDGSDAGPNGLDAVVLHNVTPATDRFGNPGGALEFNGVDSYIELPANSLFLPHTSPGGVIRISAWVKVLGFGTDSHIQPRQPVVSLGFYGNGWSYAMYVVDPSASPAYGQPQSWGSSIWQKNGSGHSEITGPANSVQLNQWTFVEIEYKYKEFNRVWVNGVLVAEQTSGFVGEPGDTTPLIGPWIGARRDGQYLRAVIDDVRFYNHPTPEPVTVVLWGLGAAATVASKRLFVRAGS